MLLAGKSTALAEEQINNVTDTSVSAYEMSGRLSHTPLDASSPEFYTIKLAPPSLYGPAGAELLWHDFTAIRRQPQELSADS